LRLQVNLGLAGWTVERSDANRFTGLNRSIDLQPK
jgi:hypothetical protein